MGGIKPVKMANGGLVPSGGLPYGSPRGALGGYGGMGLGTGMGYAEGGEATDIDLEDLEPETQNRVVKYMKENPGLTAIDAIALALLVIPVPPEQELAAGATKRSTYVVKIGTRCACDGRSAQLRLPRLVQKAAKTGVEKAVGKGVARHKGSP